VDHRLVASELSGQVYSVIGCRDDASGRRGVLIMVGTFRRITRILHACAPIASTRYRRRRYVPCLAEWLEQRIELAANIVTNYGSITIAVEGEPISKRQQLADEFLSMLTYYGEASTPGSQFFNSELYLMSQNSKTSHPITVTLSNAQGPDQRCFGDCYATHAVYMRELLDQQLFPLTVSQATGPDHDKMTLGEAILHFLEERWFDESYDSSHAFAIDIVNQYRTEYLGQSPIDSTPHDGLFSNHIEYNYADGNTEVIDKHFGGGWYDYMKSHKTSPSSPSSPSLQFLLGPFYGDYNIPVESENGDSLTATGTIALSLESIRFTQQVSPTAYVADITDSVTIGGPWGQNVTIAFSQATSLDLDYEVEGDTVSGVPNIVVDLSDGSQNYIELYGYFSNGSISMYVGALDIDGYESINSSGPFTFSGTSQLA
jgi:hypothetical protein